MATQAISNQEAVKSSPPTITKPKWPVPLKGGTFGPQGSGKSTTDALIAVAISVLHCNRAPVFVVDPEAAWPFLKRRIFDVEGVELIMRPYRSFKSLQSSIREAEKLGCCAWIADPITIHWNELMQTYQGKKGFVGIDQWGDVRKVWNDYVTDFLSSPMTCIASGRLGNEFEEREEEVRGEIRTKTVKVGTKFKAGGGESFGYEPHLLLEFSLERKPKRVAGQKLEGEGRMVHRADVLKDRTWALNGMVLRFSDKPGYQKGGYKAVWDAIKPHFSEVQASLAQGVIGTDTSESLIVTGDGQGEYWRNKQRKEVLAAELHATMDALWGGTAISAKQMRMKVFEHIFGFKSKEAADAASLDTIERGVRILQAFERRVKNDANLLTTDELNILANLDIDIKEHDDGQADELALPF